MKISFIGYGTIAQAIAQGLMKQKNYSLSAASPSLPNKKTQNLMTSSNNKAVVEGADIVVLAVKPMLMDAVLKEIASELDSNCLLISVATGLNFDWFAQRLSAKPALIRAMPNTPAQLGYAATALIANRFTSARQKQKAEQIFSSIGLTAWAENEEEMDSFTALSGSGPAYVFLFLEEMIKAAVSLGLSESIACSFALQTMEGAVQLAKHSPLDLSNLRASVTSASGTTAAALKEFEPKLGELVFAAMQAAKARAIEIGQTF